MPKLRFADVVGVLQRVQEEGHANAGARRAGRGGERRAVNEYGGGDSGDEEEEGRRARTTGMRGRQEELLASLFDQVLHDRAQLLCLLRLLLPSEDRDSVYGMKTSRMLRIVGAALAKGGRPELAARLRDWAPAPCKSLFVRGALVCMPEIEIASAASAAGAIAATRENAEARDDDDNDERAAVGAGPLSASIRTVQQACAFCDGLTRAYLSTGNATLLESYGGGADTEQTEQFLRILFGETGHRLDFREWLTLTRILLRQVSICGAGAKTVLGALARSLQSFWSGAALSAHARNRLAALPAVTAMAVNGKHGLPAFYARHRSLPALADAAVRVRLLLMPPPLPLSPFTGSAPPLGLECGVPFQPMTGDALKSPYLLKWIFSREERLRKPIPPIEGRLLIVPSPSAVAVKKEGADDRTAAHDGEELKARWFVPLNSRYKMRMVDLADERVLGIASRRRHMALLREFKQACLLDGGSAQGLILHYSLSSEGNGHFTLLLRSASNALESGVELAESSEESGATTVVEPATDAFRTLPLEEFLPRLIRRPSDASPNESEIVSAGSFGALSAPSAWSHPKKTVQVIVAPRGGRRKQRRADGGGKKKKAPTDLLKGEDNKEEDKEDKKNASPTPPLAGGGMSLRPRPARLLLDRRKKAEGEAARIAERVAKKIRPASSAKRGAQDEEWESDEDHDYAPGRNRKGGENNNNNGHDKKKEEAESKKNEEGRIAAQIKYDGDRMQAHILWAVPHLNDERAAGIPPPPQAALKVGGGVSEEERSPEVRLFSKNGYDVSELYSDIVEALQKELPYYAQREGAPNGPGCILDGELVVIDDETGNPIPWDNEKWRYNHGKSEAGQEEGGEKKKRNQSHEKDKGKGDEEEEGGGGGVLMLEYDETETFGGTCWEEASDVVSAFLGEPAMSFLPRENANKKDDASGNAGTARRWRRGMERRSRACLNRNARLQFIVFDILMQGGVDVSMEAYSARFGRLRSLFAKRGPGGALCLPGYHDNPKNNPSPSLGAASEHHEIGGGDHRRNVALPSSSASTDESQNKDDGGNGHGKASGRPSSAHLARQPHVRMIPDTRWIQTADELVRLMREATEKRLEGYVLKDPDAPYTFGRSPAMQKMKLAGPDINCAVLGIGFSLSTNPRRWGVMTGLPLAADDGGGEGERHDNDDDGAGVESVERTVEYYCRTEMIEGDRPYKAFETVYGLRSKVAVRDILNALAQSAKRKKKESSTTAVLELPYYRVSVSEKRWRGDAAETVNNSGIIEVRWEARRDDNDDDRRYGDGYEAGNGCVRIPRGRLGSSASHGLKDVQWLCSPWECPFSLSLRGDLRPLEHGVVRHPVGRIEIVGRQVGSGIWDTRKRAQQKFKEAAEADACIVRHTLNRIRRLRALPPTPHRLEEVRRIALGWAGAIEKKGQSSEAWPQLPPGTFVSMNDFSAALTGAADAIIAGGEEGVHGGKALREEVLRALRKLSPEERQALAGLPSRSQWFAMEYFEQKRRQERRTADGEEGQPSSSSFRFGRGGDRVPAETPDKTAKGGGKKTAGAAGAYYYGQRFRMEDEAVEAAAEKESREDLTARLLELKAHLGRGLVLSRHDVAMSVRDGGGRGCGAASITTAIPASSGTADHSVIKMGKTAGALPPFLSFGQGLKLNHEETMRAPVAPPPLTLNAGAEWEGMMDRCREDGERGAKDGSEVCSSGSGGSGGEEEVNEGDRYREHDRHPNYEEYYDD